MKLNEVNPQIENIFGCPSALPRDERNLQLQSFQVDPSEQTAIDTLSNTLFKYIVIKESCLLHNILADVKSFCGMALPNVADIQCSNIVNMSIVDLHADILQGMEMVISKLYKEYGIGTTPVQYIVLVGCRLFFNCIEYFILKTPSAEVPQRKAKLQTFARSNVNKKKIKQLDREVNIVARCIHRAFAWNGKFGCDQHKDWPAIH